MKMTSKIHYNKIKDENDKTYIVRCPFKNCNSRIIQVSPELSQKLPRYNINNLKNVLINILDNNNDDDDDDDYDIRISIGGKSDNENELKKLIKLNDMWDFDNIGVSRPNSNLINESFIIKDIDHSDTEILKEDIGKSIEIIRYLVCADCDRGPIGIAANILDSVSEEQQDGEVKDLNKVNANPNTLVYFLSVDSVLYELKD
ncbi:hypothetical protein B5S32_g2436 [[Candida] boidinii]|nr:hypothetical protein B5S32_g2436 [[Candida] boidinii]